MKQFEEIRPYNDNEVSTVLNRLLNDQDFIHSLANYQYPKLTKYLKNIFFLIFKKIIEKKIENITSIQDIQALIEKYITSMINKTTDGITYSGIENLSSNTAYTFISNHRDIVLDPALINYCIYIHHFNTVRIAIGDNLLQKSFASDLMRLNKSFIVKRSMTGRREKLEMFHTLSSYIRHSIDTNNSIWIAQSEGRAKDGNDITDSTILKMLYMSYKKEGIDTEQALKNMNIVPIAISYEYDPCDYLKAKELYELDQHGYYKKAMGEDMNSIMTGISGSKGKIHINFGQAIIKPYSDLRQYAYEIDQQIHKNYHLHGSNWAAWQRISYKNKYFRPPITQFITKESLHNAQKNFEKRLDKIHPKYHKYIIRMYANPVIKSFQ